jgi:hypothetical protein
MNLRGLILIVFLMGCTQNRMDSLRAEPIPLAANTQSLTRIEENDAPRDVMSVTTSYTTSDSVQDIREFYQTAFVSQGWKTSFMETGARPIPAGDLRFGKSAQNESGPAAPTLVRNITIDIDPCGTETCVVIREITSRSDRVIDIN